MATRNNKLKLKRSNVSGKIPDATQVDIGELALNTADAKVYTPYTSGNTTIDEIRQIGWDRLSTESGGTVNGDVTIKNTLFADIISGDTQDTVYYGDGSQLKNITTSDFYVTGGTLINNSKDLKLKRNDGQTISITGFNPDQILSYNANEMFVNSNDTSAFLAWLPNTTVSFVGFDSANNTVSEAGFLFNTDFFGSHEGKDAQLNIFWTMNGTEETTAPLILNFTTGSTETTSYFGVIHDTLEVTLTGYNGTDPWKILSTGWVDLPHNLIHDTDIVNIQLKRDTSRNDDNMTVDYAINTVEIRH